MKPSQTLGEYLGELLDSGVHVKDLPEGDPLRAKGEEFGDRFTEGVAFLKRFPNENIARLMSLVWDIVGHRVVPVALGPGVVSLTFGALKKGPKVDGIIFVPPKWNELLQRDPVFQVGALVFVGSQVVDFYNERLYEGVIMQIRARAYEAEYLREIQRMSPKYALNEYQEELLRQFPDGLLSGRSRPHIYTSKAFVAPS